jgi:hypothetical protein
MSITEFNIVFPGQNQSVKPRFGHLHTTDTLAVVSAAGYLNPYMISQGFSILDSDFIFVSAADGHQIYKPVFTGTSVQLTVLP